jgi:hypothetical protein
MIAGRSAGKYNKGWLCSFHDNEYKKEKWGKKERERILKVLKKEV